MSTTPDSFASRDFFKDNTYPQIPNHLDIILIGWKLKSPENMGSLVRLAANMGLKEVIFINNSTDIKRSSKINKTARSAIQYVKITNIEPDQMEATIPSDYRWIALETCSGSENIFISKLPDKMALFLGNEISGLPSSIVSMMTQTIHIPMTGNIPSMNVASAATVAAFEWYRKKLHAK